MKDLLSAIAAPLMGLIALKIGHIWGRSKTEAEVEKVELDNLEKIVNFYKNTFKDLEFQLNKVSEKCQALSKEIDELRTENVSLKNDIHNLNEQLQKYQPKIKK